MRDGYHCVVCGSSSNPQCGHILSRVSYATRWDERNAACQCASCNYRHEYTPYPFIKWAMDNVGVSVLEELQRMWNKPRHLTNSQLREMASELEKKIEQIGVGNDKRQCRTDKRYNDRRQAKRDCEYGNGNVLVSKPENKDGFDDGRRNNGRTQSEEYGSGENCQSIPANGLDLSKMWRPGQSDGKDVPSV